MPLIDIFAPWRNGSPFVWRFPWKPSPHLPYISDKMARDAGIDPQTLAKLRHQWPSQSIPRVQNDHLVRHLKGR